jgi:hypothetical protein
MKKAPLIIALTLMLLSLVGCSTAGLNNESTNESTSSEVISSESTNEVSSKEDQIDSGLVLEESDISDSSMADSSSSVSALYDDLDYIGEYIDNSDNLGLEIAKEDDGLFKVQIEIYRLASFNDGCGELASGILTFTATDPSGNPISGEITVENNVATVVFTNSTWEYIENGDSFQFTKSSDTANLW